MKKLLNKIKMIISIFVLKAEIKKLSAVITQNTDCVNINVKLRRLGKFYIYNNNDLVAVLSINDILMLLNLGKLFFCTVIYIFCIKYSIEKY